MESTRVGIREFRAGIAQYIAASTPVALTRHGQTVGYFVPTGFPTEAQVAAFRSSSAVLDKQLTAHRVDAESVVADFKAARKKARRAKAAHSVVV